MLEFHPHSPGVNEPAHVDPSTYGIDPATGVFIHPKAAPYLIGPRPVEGSLGYLEDRSYIDNMTVEAYWPIVVSPGHTYQQIVDMEGRRYMYHYFLNKLNVYDVTHPKDLKVVLQEVYEDGRRMLPAAIAFNEKLGKWIMIQSCEVPRGHRVLGGNKHTEPEKVYEYMKRPGFRGFRVYEMDGPIKWTQIAEVSTDVLHPGAEVQEGSGAMDLPIYYGGKYACIAAAPDNTFVRMEYPSYLYSSAQMIYDVEDPANPKLVSTWWVPGQRLGEESAYRQWPQYDNRTSWTGARMPIVPDRPLEQGGRYGYTFMGGLGFHVLDLSEPSKMKTLGSLNVPLSVGGIEGDNVDASRVADRGLVLINGYPMNEDGYEPWKDVFIVDVNDPTSPRIVGTLPRPKPPKEAPYADYALRGGKFGPKRHGYFCQPGKADPDLAIYPYNNAGVQMFDISNPADAKIVGYFVPPMTDDLNNPTSYTNPVECILTEWDRKLVWVFANSGIYLLSSPALGKPDL